MENDTWSKCLVGEHMSVACNNQSRQANIY